MRCEKLLLIVLLFFCSCSEQKNTDETGQNHIKIASSEDPSSIDPRLVRDLPTVTVLKALYEGMTRANEKGDIELALAKNFEVSDDLKTYTFTLRNSVWTDGQPFTAEDFEQTWKSILSPDFPAPNAYQLYVIKNAKDAKEGKISIDQVGVKAVSSDTLVVELEQPAPYFLELLSCHFYLPVSPQMRQSGQANDSYSFPTNGPFQLSHWKRRNEISVVKSPSYWDKDSVKLDRLTFQILDETTAYQLFKSGQLDWAGSPTSTLPQDAVAYLKQQKVLKVAPSAGTYWFRFNTERSPFNNEKLRRAFNLALNRQAIVDHVTQGNQTPAIGIIPPSFPFPHPDYFHDNDTAHAKTLFEEAKKEIIDLPKITLRYGANDRNHKIAQAVQQQWNKTFDIQLELESSEPQVLYDLMRRGEYQISLGSWFADIRDPINFLEIFKSKSNPTNQTFWQNQSYIDLLNRSSMESDSKQRLQTLSEAEKILIEAMPIAPLFYSSYNYLTKPEVKGVYFSELGYLDFKQAYLEAKQ